MRRPASLAAVPLFALVCSAQPAPTTAKALTDAERLAKWEPDIVKLEKKLKAAPPASDPVVFAGSSSIVKWDLEKSFPGRGYVNVGFGGSQIRDCAHFAPRLVGPLKPKTVVFYAGDNDINAKRTPEQVRDDFKAFAAAVHADAPKAKILFVSIKPSVARWAQYPTQTKANALVKEFCGTDPRLKYVDTVPAMLGPDGGKPDAELFVKDGLHMSPKGYAIFAAAVSKALEQ